jgi:hypothetical protein
LVELGIYSLIQPAEVRTRRIECIKAIKVFDESEKRIRMDPDISKLIRASEKESQYVRIPLVSTRSLA